MNLPRECSRRKEAKTICRKPTVFKKFPHTYLRVRTRAANYCVRCTFSLIFKILLPLYGPLPYHRCFLGERAQYAGKFIPWLDLCFKPFNGLGKCKCCKRVHSAHLNICWFVVNSVTTLVTSFSTDALRLNWEYDRSKNPTNLFVEPCDLSY